MHYIYAHIIGDYLLQNDWMARNKKKSTFHCLVHVFFCMIPFIWVKDITPIQFSLIAVQHFIQDRTGFIVWFIRFKGSSDFIEHLGLWASVLMDNIFHILFIALVLGVM